MRILVKSVDKVSKGYSVADIWKLHPVILVGDEVFEIVHPKMQEAEDVTFVGEDKQEITFRVRRIKPLVNSFQSSRAGVSLARNPAI